jgi:hypothetical protein
VDNNGNFVPVKNPSDAVYTCTGTLDYALDQNGNPVNMVELYTKKGPQTVTYNITFSLAEFKSSVVPKFDVTQKQGDPPWQIMFQVDLSQAEVQLASLPSATQAAIQQAVGGLGPDMFSIQQLYLDLNTARFDSFTGIEGMSTYAGSVLAGIMGQYLANLQASNGIIFGYSIKASSQNAVPATFMPTAVGFGVAPYFDQNGNHSNPALDTLNYLIMTNNRQLPVYPPDSWGFNWVDDSSLQGAIAIRHGLYLNYLIGQLNPILKAMSPVAYVNASTDRNIDDQTMELRPGSDHTFNVLDPPQNDVIATYSYTSPPAHDKDRDFFGGTVEVNLSYSSTCSLTVSGPTIKISGTAVVSADSSTESNGSILDHQMPETTYAWSADLVLSMDLQNNGQLDYTVQNPNFDSKPTVAKHNESAWDKF